VVEELVLRKFGGALGDRGAGGVETAPVGRGRHGPGVVSCCSRAGTGRGGVGQRPAQLGAVVPGGLLVLGAALPPLGAGSMPVRDGLPPATPVGHPTGAHLPGGLVTEGSGTEFADPLEDAHGVVVGSAVDDLSAEAPEPDHDVFVGHAAPVGVTGGGVLDGSVGCFTVHPQDDAGLLESRVDTGQDGEAAVRLDGDHSRTRLRRRR